MQWTQLSLSQCVTAVVLSLGCLVPTQAAAHVLLSRLIVFGDSLSDAGNYFIAYGESSHRPFEPIPEAPYPIGGHHYSNGATWAEQLAMALHMPLSGGPALRAPGVFTNYAVGRARARANAATFAAYDLDTQVELFLADFDSTAPVDAVYVIWIGANDLNDALYALAVDPSGATSLDMINQAIDAVVDNVQTLWAAGARVFIMPNMPNFAVLPAVRAEGLLAQAIAGAFTLTYNHALAQAVRGLQDLPHTHFISVDIYTLVNSLIAAPGDAGLTNVTDPCLRFGVVANAICAQPNLYLFWDAIHPTHAGHRLLAQAVYQHLAAP